MLEEWRQVRTSTRASICDHAVLTQSRTRAYPCAHARTHPRWNACARTHAPRTTTVPLPPAGAHTQTVRTRALRARAAPCPRAHVPTATAPAASSAAAFAAAAAAAAAAGSSVRGACGRIRTAARARRGGRRGAGPTRTSSRRSWRAPPTAGGCPSARSARARARAVIACSLSFRLEVDSFSSAGGGRRARPAEGGCPSARPGRADERAETRLSPGGVRLARP